MQIQLISGDRELHRLCRDILSDLRGGSLQLVADETYAPTSGAEICIWDCSAAVPVPASHELDYDQKHLFLVERRQVTAVLRTLPVAALGLLLKPVNRATLTAFLEQAVTLREARAARPDPSNSGIVHADRDEILQYLLEANLKLQEYDHDRTNFLARATHDFRAPLTAVSGYCGLLLEGLLGPLTADQKEVLQRMQHSSKRLARMAAALFDLSVGRQLRKELRFQDYPIEKCLEQALHELAPFSEEKHISVAVQLTRPSAPLYLEPTKIEQLLVNLLDNACKFTPKYGVIEITGYPSFWERRSRSDGKSQVERRVRQCNETNSFRVDIKDSGPSIPEELRSSIFEEYTSYSGPEDRSGGGLGLAICRTIVQSHHGHIWVTAEPDGMMFSFTLPLRLPEAEPTMHVPNLFGSLHAGVGTN